MHFPIPYFSLSLFSYNFALLSTIAAGPCARVIELMSAVEPVKDKKTWEPVKRGFTTYTHENMASSSPPLIMTKEQNTGDLVKLSRERRRPHTEAQRHRRRR